MGDIKNKKIKVVFITYPTVALPGGGILRQVLETKKHLEDGGEIEIELFDMWKNYDWEKIDIVHLFCADMRSYFLIDRLSTCVPLIISPIIDKKNLTLFKLFFNIFKRLPSPLLTSYKSYFRAKQKGDYFVVRSFQEKELLEKGLGVEKNKIKIVFNGVNSIFEDSSPDKFIKKYGINDFILYVGQIGEKRKNLIRLLKVARKLPDFKFVLIGPILKNKESDRILKIAHHLKNVKVLGKVPEGDLISAYSACDVFVLPSLIEGTGLVALEAALAGAKIAITKNGGTFSYFGNRVEYLNPYSVLSIKKAILKAKNSFQQPSLKEHIKNKFLWEKVIIDLRNLYKEIIYENKKRR